MEADPGGNSRYGENEITAFPWAAHYVPVPGEGAVLVREMLAEFGLLRDGQWEERHLCHAPQERLFLHGRWQEGIEPDLGATPADRAQYRRFHQRMREFAATGEFRIPIDTGSRPTAELDRLSFATWLRNERFDSPYLHWLAGYSCRDDYGASAEAASAWAGIHYFAARDAEERRPEDRGPLTWPEGNGWIAKKLAALAGPRLRTSSFVHRIAREGAVYRVFAGESEIRAAAVIFAAPVHLARYMVAQGTLAGDAARAVEEWNGAYSPWLTANLTLDRPPKEKGFPPAWDNVIYRSPALGYVDATHQSLRTRRDRGVWTYYWALANGSPAEGRRLLLERDWAVWKDAILADLAQAHPDIRDCVSRIDIMRMGHAMIRPSVGWITSPVRRLAAALQGRFVFANSDLSGISIFEEAQYRGVTAAGRVARAL